MQLKWKCSNTNQAMNILEYLQSKTQLASGSELKFILSQIALIQKKEKSQGLYEEHSRLQRLIPHLQINWFFSPEARQEEPNKSLYEILANAALELERFVELEKTLFSRYTDIPKPLLPLSFFGSQGQLSNLSSKKAIQQCMSSGHYRDFWNKLIMCDEDKVTSILLPRLPIPSELPNPENIRIHNLQHINLTSEDFNSKYVLEEAIALRLLSTKSATKEEAQIVRDFNSRSMLLISKKIAYHCSSAKATLSEELFSIIEIPNTAEKKAQFAHEMLSAIYSGQEMSESWKLFIIESLKNCPSYYTGNRLYVTQSFSKLCLFLVKYPEYIPIVKPTYPNFKELASSILSSIANASGAINWEGVNEILKENFRLPKPTNEEIKKVFAQFIINPPKIETLRALLSRDSANRSVRTLVGLYGLYTCQSDVLKLITLSQVLITKFIETRLSPWTSKCQVAELCLLLPKNATQFKCKIAKNILRHMQIGKNKSSSKPIVADFIQEWLPPKQEQYRLTDSKTCGAEQIAYLLELFPEVLPHLDNAEKQFILVSNLDDILPIPNEGLADAKLLKYTTEFNIEKMLQIAQPTEDQMNSLIEFQILKPDIPWLTKIVELGIKLNPNTTHRLIVAFESSHINGTTGKYLELLIAIAKHNKLEATPKVLAFAANNLTLLLEYVRQGIVTPETVIDSKSVLARFNHNFEALKLFVRMGFNPFENWAPTQPVNTAISQFIDDVIAANTIHQECTATVTDITEIDMF